MIYTGEVINFDGKDFKVIDTSKLDFSKAKLGVKASLTKIVVAKNDEIIETKNNKGEVETIHKVKKGEIIFCNNDDDRYCPCYDNGNGWKLEDIEKNGYVFVENKDDCIMIRSNNKALLLVEFIQENSCIKDAFGEGQHQFLYKGEKKKKDLKTEKITGIDKIAFENTWTILEK